MTEFQTPIRKETNGYRGYATYVYACNRCGKECRGYNNQKIRGHVYCYACKRLNDREKNERKQAEHDAQVRVDAIDEYKQRLLEDLIPLKDKYFDIAKGTSMPERYTHLKRMDTVDLIIEMVELKAEQLKENR